MPLMSNVRDHMPLPQVDFDSWADLERHVRALSETEREGSRRDAGYFSHLLFRGQGSDVWPLETTLERKSPVLRRLKDFYRVVERTRTQVETFTGRTWSETELSEVWQWMTDYDSMGFRPLPGYDYLVYLRHHGFPSPLLDWSRSLYVAAYFAYESPRAERIALYAYQEYAGRGKLGSSANAQIRLLGPYIRSHPRHFLQQAEYTMSVHFLQEEWCIAKHSDVFDHVSEGQDRLWKFTAPASESPDVLRRLDEYNVNAFSLFQTEDALLRTLAHRTLHCW
jgi:FRG domain